MEVDELPVNHLTLLVIIASVYNSLFRPRIDEFESQIKFPLPVRILLSDGIDFPIELNYHLFQIGYHQPELTEESKLTRYKTQTYHHNPDILK